MINLDERVSQIDVPLRLYATPGEKLELMIVYNEEQYKYGFVENMLKSLKIILREICKDEQATVYKIREKFKENIEKYSGLES